MTSRNASLTDARLVVKCRALVARRECMLENRSILLGMRHTIVLQSTNALRAKASYRFTQEKTIVDYELFVVNAMLKATEHEHHFCVQAVIDRGLCEAGHVHEFLGVWKHEE